MKAIVINKIIGDSGIFYPHDEVNVVGFKGNGIYVIQKNDNDNARITATTLRPHDVFLMMG